MSKETKEKIAASKRGKKLSEETKRKMSAVRKGVKHSAKHQEAVNQSLRRPEVRMRISVGIRRAIHAKNSKLA